MRERITHRDDAFDTSWLYRRPPDLQLLLLYLFRKGHELPWRDVSHRRGDYGHRLLCLQRRPQPSAAFMPTEAARGHKHDRHPPLESRTASRLLFPGKFRYLGVLGPPRPKDRVTYSLWFSSLLPGGFASELGDVSGSPLNAFPHNPFTHRELTVSVSGSIG